MFSDDFAYITGAISKGVSAFQFETWQIIESLKMVEDTHDKNSTNKLHSLSLYSIAYSYHTSCLIKAPPITSVRKVSV